jgi:hypothetical protein
MKVRDCIKIKKDDLINLYKSGGVKFIEKYDAIINRMITEQEK